MRSNVGDGLYVQRFSRIEYFLIVFIRMFDPQQKRKRCLPLFALNNFFCCLFRGVLLASRTSRRVSHFSPFSCQQLNERVKKLLLLQRYGLLLRLLGLPFCKLPSLFVGNLLLMLYRLTNSIFRNNFVRAALFEIVI